MRHKHADLIIKWANGAEIQHMVGNKWVDVQNPSWQEFFEYRVRPKEMCVYAYASDGEVSYFTKDPCRVDNLKLMFDEQGKLIDAEVIK